MTLFYEEEKFQDYYLVWRGDEQFFYVTKLTLHPEFYASLSNQQLVQMCDDVENPDSKNRFVGADAPTYEIVTVFTGDNIQFVEKE